MCQYSITYGKIDFKIPIGLPCIKKVWYYKNANADKIKRVLIISHVDLDFLF